MTDNSANRLLIFIVAYNAERTISSVLKRIPVKSLPPDTEVLVIDDSSSDRTFEKARENPDVLEGLKLTVLRNPVNQGYGGNQKIGYEYAIQNGFKAVALVHGDGQYAPEKLPDLVKPVLSGEAEACFGSRMMERGAALKNGMPLYKYIGNKILTCYQNTILGMNMSEFHSGYRIYSVDALRQLPFRLNTNNFHFDTEIIIQFKLKGFRIVELPIPTYYGDEICYVNGLAYAWDVFRVTLASRIHQLGIMYQRKFDVLGDEPRYDIKTGYVSSHTMAIDTVPSGARVLDMACGPGYVAAELNRKNCRVVGIDKIAPVDQSVFERFVAHDLDSPQLPGDLGEFDCILMLDCLEHLDRPERLVELVRSRLYGEKTKIVLTAPNIGFFATRFGLLLGQFNYGRWGILDLTHRRLYTFASFRRMLEQSGYRVLRIKGIPAPFPKAFGNGFIGRLLLGIDRFLLFFCRGMFSYQIFVEAEFLPPVGWLLSRAVSVSSKCKS
jgi:glycosyltransferase involved in cell wall biosynthesis